MRTLWIVAVCFLLTGCNESASEPEPVVNLESRLDIYDKFDQSVSTFTAGEDVILELTVSNPNNSAIKIWYLSPGSDYLVLRDGDVVWQYRNGVVYAAKSSEGMDIRSFTLEPGDFWKGRAIWKGVDNDGDLVPPGEYEIKTTRMVWWFYGEDDERIDVPVPDSRVIEIR